MYVGTDLWGKVTNDEFTAFLLNEKMYPQERKYYFASTDWNHTLKKCLSQY